MNINDKSAADFGITCTGRELDELNIAFFRRFSTGKGSTSVSGIVWTCIIVAGLLAANVALAIRYTRNPFAAIAVMALSVAAACVSVYSFRIENHAVMLRVGLMAFTAQILSLMQIFAAFLAAEANLSYSVFFIAYFLIFIVGAICLFIGMRSWGWRLMRSRVREQRRIKRLMKSLEKEQHNIKTEKIRTILLSVVVAIAFVVIFRWLPDVVDGFGEIFFTVLAICAYAIMWGSIGSGIEGVRYWKFFKRQASDEIFAQAAEINESSDLPYKYMSRFDQYSRDEIIVRRQYTVRELLNMYKESTDGDIKLKAEEPLPDKIDASGRYLYAVAAGDDFSGTFSPLLDGKADDEEQLYLSNICIEKADYHVYGVRVGDNIKAAANKLIAAGFSRVTDDYEDSDESDEDYEFVKRYITIELDEEPENTVVAIGITVDI